MRKNALVVPAQLTVSGDVTELAPLPTARFGDVGAGLNVALRERLSVHASILPHSNS